MRSGLDGVAGALVLAALLLACAPSTGRCEELPLEPSFDARLGGWELDFTPVRPCGTGQMRVTNVVLDEPAGAPRVSFVVGVDGAPVFILGHSRAVRAPTQIPDGATRLDWQERGTKIMGFEHPAGEGPAVIYLRWEAAGLVHEFQANPSPRFTASLLREVGRRNVVKTLEAVEEAR